MEVKTYRAKTMQEALALVRRDLGPSAAVLHTRDVRGGLLGWMSGSRCIEVTASTQVAVPSRFPDRDMRAEAPKPAVEPTPQVVDAVPTSFGGLAALGAAGNKTRQSDGTTSTVDEEARRRFRDELRGQLNDLQSMVEDLCRRSQRSLPHEVPESLFHLYTDLIDAEVNEDLARELVTRFRSEASGEEIADRVLAKARLARMIEDEIVVAGPIQVTPGHRRIVALVGPTGVGKTTTIAKLAANFRLREKRKIGLITVDTYRIAAVEQLRTYADIIELPMEVVSSPREMREAVASMSHLDLILMDTAGRSPRDEIKIQELRSLLAEAAPDEVHLVLSSVASASSLTHTAQQFATAGTTSIILTKLDEAHGLGNLLPLVRSSKLPLSYLTDGQNVPDDIAPADRKQLARIVLGMERVG